MWVAVVSWGGDNRVTKFAQYATQQEADDHVATYGGFAFENTNNWRWEDWLVQNGNSVVFDAAVEPVQPAISKVQFKIAAKRAGQIDAIRTALQDQGIDEEVRILWNDAPTIGRTGQLMTAIQTAMGYTDEQVDNFFRTAQNINEN